MKPLEERITEAEGALREAEASGDDARKARAEARLDTLREAQEFHSKEFERVGKKIRSEGGEAKEKEIAESLGVTLQEAKQIIADHRAIQEATETETETERKAREAAEKERDEEREGRRAAEKLANERLIKAELKLELISAGARKDRLAKLLREADLSEVTLEGEEVQNLEPVVKTLKEEEPDWFGSEDRPSGSRATPNPSDAPNDGQGDKEAAEAQRAQIGASL